FHGGEGMGKSSLLRRLRGELPPETPSALLDLESLPVGSLAVRDQARTLAELRGQFAVIPCPRFDLAYSFLSARQRVKVDPLLPASGLARASADAIAQLTSDGGFYAPAAF